MWFQSSALLTLSTFFPKLPIAFSFKHPVMKKDVFTKSPYRSLKDPLYNLPCSLHSNVFNQVFSTKSLLFTVPPAAWTIRESTLHFKLGKIYSIYIYFFFIFFWCISENQTGVKISIQKPQNVLHLCSTRFKASHFLLWRWDLFVSCPSLLSLDTAATC